MKQRTLVGSRALMAIGVLSTIGIAVVSTSSTAGAVAARANVDPVIYNSIDNPLPGNNASQSFEATSTSEFGDQIALAGTAHVLTDVTVTMSSWGCQSGNWFNTNSGSIGSPTPGSCVTTPGSTFDEPVTLNIYRVGINNSVGNRIATQTQTFHIPYRPSSLPQGASCTPTSSTDGQAWYDPVTTRCVHGLFTNISFTFGHVTLPSRIIYGIAYNTSDYGYSPYGDATACHATAQGCGYDSLNVGLSVEPFEPSVGSDPNLGTAYLNTTWAGAYCDDGAGGTGTLRIDGRPDTNNCWNGGGGNTGYSYYGIENGGPVPAGNVSPYVVPSVQFGAVLNPSPSITSADTVPVVAGTPFSFAVTTTGVPAPTLMRWAGKLPNGLGFSQIFAGGQPTGTAIISGTVPTTVRNHTYTITIRAVNGIGSVAKQRLKLVLTGGRN